MDRSKIGRGDAAIVNDLRSRRAVHENVSDPGVMGLLGRRMRAFYDFTARMFGPVRGWQPDRPWRVDELDVAGLRIGVLQLNSAWTAGSDGEKGCLVVGEPQVRDALELAADAELKIALLHHPPDYLRDFDAEKLEGLFGSPDGVDLVLRGHLHKNKAALVANPDGRTIWLAAGAAYTSPDYPKQVAAGCVDLATGELKLELFRYSDEGRGFWRRDVGAYEGAPDGVWRIPVPALEARLAPEPVEAAPSEAAVERKVSLTARYRRAAASYHGRVRFIALTSACAVSRAVSAVLATSASSACSTAVARGSRRPCAADRAPSFRRALARRRAPRACSVHGCDPTVHDR